MLKQYLEANNISIYKLSKLSGIPYSTLNDLANMKIDGERCSAGVVKKLSDTLGLSMDETYSMCSYTKYYERDGATVKRYIKEKSLYLDFYYKDFVNTQKIFPIQNENLEHIEAICLHELDKFVKENERRAIACIML